VLKVESSLVTLLVGNAHVLSFVVNINVPYALGEDPVRDIADDRSCSEMCAMNPKLRPMSYPLLKGSRICFAILCLRKETDGSCLLPLKYTQ
jgi:hypothetical protein